MVTPRLRLAPILRLANASRPQGRDLRGKERKMDTVVTPTRTAGPRSNAQIRKTWDHSQPFPPDPNAPPVGERQWTRP